MIIFLEILVVFVAFLFVLLLIKVARKSIPEFDKWWRKANAVDPVAQTLEDIKEEEQTEAKRAREAEKLSNERFKRNKQNVLKILKERRPL